jgi:hypothetical protein
MKKREFLKIAGLSTLGIAGTHVTVTGTPDIVVPHDKKQIFNMSGFAAPKIDVVRIGYIGMGNRGGGAIKRIVHLASVQVKGVADILPEKANNAKKFLTDAGHTPDAYSGSPDAWKKLCERDDIDLIYICTPWNLHAPMALYGAWQTRRDGNSGGYDRRRLLEDG